MATSTNYKRLFLRGLKWDAEDSGQSLLEVLKTASRARLTSTQTGAVLRSTAGNGKTVEFSLPANGQGLSPQDAAELCEEIFGLYEAAAAGLSVAATAANESVIFPEMLALLTSAHEVHADYAELRA